MHGNILGREQSEQRQSVSADQLKGTAAASRRGTGNGLDSYEVSNKTEPDLSATSFPPNQPTVCSKCYKLHAPVNIYICISKADIATDCCC
jgi:hypothetical protein